MKKPCLKIVLIIAYVALLHACEYEPTKIYNRTVNQNVSPPEIQTVELNLDSDTINLYADKVINFNFTSNNQPIEAVIFTIDNNAPVTVASNNGTFTLDYESLTQGTHTLTIQIYTYSGSGSIADHTGAEGFMTSHSWAIIVFH